MPYNVEASIVPNTAAMKAAAEAGIADLLTRVGAPYGTVLLSSLQDVFGVITGVTDFTIVSPIANVINAFNEVSTYGTVTWD